MARTCNWISRIAAVVVAAMVMAQSGALWSAEYNQDFDFPDGTVDLGDGSIIFSSNTDPNGDPVAQVLNGQLQLTRADTGSTSANFKVPSLGADATESFIASFDFLLFDIAGGNPPADGVSFSYGPIADDAQGSEEGYGVGLSFEFDTWDNGGDEIGYNIAVNGVDAPGGFNPTDPPVDGELHSAVLLWADGAASLLIDNDVIFSGLPTPGFTPADTDRFAFAARTGGATEDFIIDNLVIQAPVPGTPGDFNGDGDINLDDFDILVNNFLNEFSPVISFTMGDNDHNGRVDLQDFVQFRQLYEAANGGGAPVPEPSTIVLVGLGLLALPFVVRRRGK